MFERHYNLAAQKILNAKAELANKELWARFNENTTEMIITKTGRRIFPILKVDLTNLEPDKFYCVLLEMQLVSPQRLKFTAETGWTPCGVEETPHPGVYVHPESPSTGEHWMAQSVNFEKCKLTNSTAGAPGSVTLTSMHKYVPKIILVQTDNLQKLNWSPSTTFCFKETEFVAVTAYQNNMITALKIDHNPFAKGFRENGKSRCKKRKFEQQLRERQNGNYPLSPSSSDSSDSSSPGPSDLEQVKPAFPVQIPECKKHCSAEHPGHCPNPERINVFQPAPYFSNNQYSGNLVQRYDLPSKPLFPYTYMPFVNQVSLYLDLQKPKEEIKHQTTRKLTDFSIKSLIGDV